MRYFIAPMEETDWYLTASQLAALLEEQWPAATLRILDPPRSNHVLEWRLRLADRDVVGSLDLTGQVIQVEGDLRACAHFARWVRTHVPATYRLRFYDEHYTAVVEMRQETTEAQLVGPFVL